MEDRAAATLSTPSFGALLRAYRLRGGFSQERLAERARVSAKAIGAIEQGARRAPYRQTVDLLVDGLDLAPEERSAFMRAADTARGRAGRNAISPDCPVAGLPQPLTRFIHRSEVDDIVLLLAKYRLVTLTGPGGVGKTRTSIETAARHARSSGIAVAFVDFSSIHDGAVVAGEIALTLDVHVRDADDALGSLIDDLASRTLLLILDNCEHLVSEAARIVASVLRHCPSISLLATSRELLGLSSEVVYRLPSLRIPDATTTRFEDAASYSAVALFVQRAQHADAQLRFGDEHLPAIVDICRKLDGIPLAIELAAARVPSTGIETLRARLKDLFALSGGRDLPPRQQTMMATIAWSFDLLSDDERALLERVCIFSGGFTLAAAEAACAGTPVAPGRIADLLMRLVDKSLVNVVNAAERTRYGVLESIKAFGLERLRTAGTLSAVARNHAAWLAAEAQVLDEQLITDVGWVDDVDNARAAIAWCIESKEQADLRLAAQIAGGMRRVWLASNREHELKSLVGELLDTLDDVEPHYALIALLWRARLNADRYCTRELIDEARPLFARAGDHEANAVSYSKLALSEARSGLFEQANASIAEAAAYFDVTGPTATRPYFVYASSAAWILSAQGKLDRARSAVLLLRAELRLVGTGLDIEADLFNVLAEIEFASGNDAQAVDDVRTALRLYDEMTIATTSAFSARINLCCYLVARGELDEAERFGKMVLAQSWTKLLDASGRDNVVDTIVILHLASIAALRKQPRFAAKLLGYIEAAFRQAGITTLPGTERRSLGTLTASLHAQLSPQELARECAAGESLDFPTVADLLLASPP